MSQRITHILLLTLCLQIVINNDVYAIDPPINNDDDLKIAQEKTSTKPKRWQRHEELFTQENAAISYNKPITIDVNDSCNSSNKEIIKSLSQQKKKIEIWEKEAKVKEKSLLLLQKNIEDKIKELSIIQTNIKKLLVQFEEQEEKRIKSLTKIYETMKPKDAAKIFETLETETLLYVTNNMKESKIAPILANMSPQKAKNITLEIINQRKKINSIKNTN